MKLTIKGTEYELQPLTAGQLRREGSAKLAEIEQVNALLEKGEITPGAAMPRMVGSCCDLVLMSLNNLYPGVTLEDVESLSFKDIRSGVEAVAQVTGLDAPGEAKPQDKRSR
jgi:hypothetical protein